MEDKLLSLQGLDDVSELLSCCSTTTNTTDRHSIYEYDHHHNNGIDYGNSLLSNRLLRHQHQQQQRQDPLRLYCQHQHSLVSDGDDDSSSSSSSSDSHQHHSKRITDNDNKTTKKTSVIKMSSGDPLNASGASEEEDLDALLAQADSMISAASGGIVIDGFAIDSDEEEEAGDNGRTRTGSSGEDDIVDVSMESPKITRPTGDPLLHPLQEGVVNHDDPLQQTTTTTTAPPPPIPYNNNNQNNNYQQGMTMPSPTAAAATSHFSASVTSAMRNLGVGGAAVTTGGDPNAQHYQTQQQQQQAAPSLESQFKAQTSRFAANLSSMAQRVASVASNVTPNHNNADGMTNGGLSGSFHEANFPPPMSVPAVLQQQQQLLQQNNMINSMNGPRQTINTAGAMSNTTGSGSSNTNSPYASQSNSAHGLPGSNSSTTLSPPQMMLNFELDAEQKTALVERHVGRLLPGEIVIMFLHNLLHVSDSTMGFQYVANSSSTGQQQQQQGVVWCCAMTYYRLIMFGTTQEMILHIMNTTTTTNHNTATTEQQQPPPLCLQHPFTAPSDWNASCWPPAFPTVLEMPLASMEKVEKTVYTASAPASSSLSSSLNLTNSSSSIPSPTAHMSLNQGRPTTLMGLQIWAKGGRYWRLTTPSYADTIRAHQALLTYAFPGRRNLGYLFAFESKRADVVNSVVTDPNTGQKTVSLALTRKRFDAVAEFQRQFHRGGSTRGSPINGATTTTTDGSNPTLPSVQPWKIWTQLNAQYQLCMSYPNVLVGPASLDEQNPDAVRLLQSCAAFRSEQRLPALAWASGIDGASIWRCSQPKIGLQGNRSPADELVLKHIMEAAKSANALRAQPLPVRMDASLLQAFTGANDLANSHWVKEAHCSLKILDLRPRSAAMANRTGGYGYENTSNYPGTTLQFCNIGNIHAVRDSYQKMCALCLNMTNSSDVNWGYALEDTKWLSHIRIILAASWETAFWVHVHRMPVLLHCSHGWDRTSQVSALAQLMLDPYYRTMQGFACLMEKDFMSFGHPFHTRCAHGEGKGGSGGASGGGHHQDGVVSGVTAGLVGGGSSGADGNSSAVDEGQISPIFLQFLDCVWQMVHQYPECFEFTTDYLLELSYHIYSCRFGNMLCDTERERELVAGIRQRTYSVWDFLEQNPDDPNISDPKAKLWRNKHYDPSPNGGGGLLLMPLPTLLRNVKLWREKHAPHGPKATQRWRNTVQSRLWQPRPTEVPASATAGAEPVSWEQQQQQQQQQNPN